MTKRFTVLIVMLTVLCLLFAACSKNPQTPNTDPTSENISGNETTANSEGTTIEENNTTGENSNPGTNGTGGENIGTANSNPQPTETQPVIIIEIEPSVNIFE